MKHVKKVYSDYYDHHGDHEVARLSGKELVSSFLFVTAFLIMMGLMS